jgi:hypothetical protein
MRIGIFHNAPYYLRSYQTALAALSDRGHHILLARPERYDSVKIPAALRKRRRVSTALYPWARSDELERSIGILRAARDFTRYAKPELRPAHANRQRAFERMLRSVIGKERSLSLVHEPPSLDVLEEDDRLALDRFFADLESLVPADAGLARFIQEHRLQAVISVSRVNIAAREVEIVKAAKSVGVPVGVVVYSWDNLSSKGLLHEQPDTVFVWNEVQAAEAERLHGIPASKIAITGAPRFDPFFKASPSATRAELLAELGLGAEHATILYLGSSSFVAPNEPDFVDNWLRALRASTNDALAGANVVVRPHPGTTDDPAWSTWGPADARVVVTPAIVRKRAQDLFDQITASDVVVALNTSAEIEAAIVGRPVLTVSAGDLAPGQEGTVHFGYLLLEQGGFVESASSLDRHFEQLAVAVEQDPHADERRRFLETFVRPGGLDVAAGAVLADAIEALVGADGTAGGRIRERAGGAA